MPGWSDRAAIGKRVWTRTQADHWVSALVVQPFDLSQEPITVVCHFASTDYSGPRVEVLAGDRVDRLKKASLSNLDPRAWAR
jgi:hypothetical protein